MATLRMPLAVGAALLALAGCGPSPANVAADAVSGGAQADRGRPVEVLSRNLYLGAVLDPVVLATTPQGFLAATTQVWQTVVGNDFHARALLLAKEIATVQPELVGLQEAYLWRVQEPGDALLGGRSPATEVAYDYVAELLAALEDLGERYTPVVTLPLFDFEAPTLLGIDVRTTDRQVILAREGVATSNATSGVFSTLLPLAVMGTPVEVQRGWTAVDAEVRGARFTFVDTHLESFHPLVRQAQAAELAAVVGAVEGPLVLVGDLNSLPGTEGAAILAAPPPLGPGLVDVWAALHPNRAGFTCCFAEALSDASALLDQRIDYVMVRGVRPLTARVLGAVPGDHVTGLWPSDHAGVTASLKLAR